MAKTLDIGIQKSILTTVGDMVQKDSSGVVSRVISPAINGFRLTLTTATPVTTTDVSAATTIYFTPYTSNRISLCDASGNVYYLASAEINKGLGTLTGALPYDVFVYDSGGSLLIDTFVAWTNATTRATAIVRTYGGFWTKSGDPTRRYVGTFYTSSTTTTADTRKARFLFNAENRTLRQMFNQDGTASWTYTTATWRQTNANTANKVEFVLGLSEYPIPARVRQQVQNSGAGVAVYAGTGMDITGSPGPSGDQAIIQNLTLVAAKPQGLFHDQTHASPGIGYHYLSQMEYSEAAGTTTWFGVTASGMWAEILS